MSVVACLCNPLQRQVSGALEAIRDVLAELTERIAERGLEADVSWREGAGRVVNRSGVAYAALGSGGITGLVR